MKKGLSVLVALAMLLTLAVPALAEAASVAGVWTMTAMISSGVEIDPVSMGMEMSMDLAEDGTGTLTAFGVGSEVTWTFDGATLDVTDPDGTVSFELQEDGTLRADISGMETIWSSGAADSPEAAPVETPAVATDVEDGAAVGVWQLVSASAANIAVDLQAMGLEILIEFAEDGTCTMTTNGVSETGAWTQDGANISMTDDASGTELVFQMLEDGTLLVDLQGMQMIFTYVGEAIEVEGGATGETSEAAFSLTLPDNWFEVTPELIDQVAASGDEMTLSVLNVYYTSAQASGSIICLDDTLASQMSLTAVHADGMKMEDLRAQEAEIAETLPGFAFGDAVQFGETEFLPATYDAPGLVQYYAIVNDVYYTFGMYNVSDADTEAILSSFVPA